MKIVRARKKNLFIRFCVLAFVAYIGWSLVSLQIEISTKNRQLAETMEKVEVQMTANKDLERQLSLGDDKAFLARIARDRLGMGLADERVFRDASGT